MDRHRHTDRHTADRHTAGERRPAAGYISGGVDWPEKYQTERRAIGLQATWPLEPFFFLFFFFFLTQPDYFVLLVIILFFFSFF